MKNFIGMLYSFDLNNPDHSPQPLKFDNFHSKFAPHGIDLYIDPQSGEVSLFVVNHGNDNKSIEIFMLDMTNMVLKHKRTVFDEKIYSPNDVVAVGKSICVMFCYIYKYIYIFQSNMLFL